jgi:hypothetical protein
MITNLAHKVTKNIYCYNLVGFPFNVVYNCNNRNIILADSETGAPISIVEKDEDLDFETFVLISQNVWMDLIESLN